jgi:hypothetical protein
MINIFIHCQKKKKNLLVTLSLIPIMRELLEVYLVSLQNKCILIKVFFNVI